MGPFTAPERGLQRQEEKLIRDELLVIIFGPRPTSVGEFWSGPVSVQDIWSGLTSVEDVNAPIEVLGGLQACAYVGGR